MKSTAIACVLVAAVLGFGSLSQAQGDDRGRSRDGRPGPGARDGGGQRQWHDGGRQRQPEYRGRAEQDRQGRAARSHGGRAEPYHEGPPPPRWGQPRHEVDRGHPAPAYGRRGMAPGGHQQAVPSWRHDGGWRGDQVQQQWQYGYDVAPQRGWRGQAPRFRSGDYLPPEYRQRQYYVNDWRAHRLYAPPAGHHWVQVDTGDYLLIAIASGIIANLLLGQ